MSTTLDGVQELYLAYFDRAADPDGLVYWTKVIGNGSNSLHNASNQFANSAEAHALYPFLINPILSGEDTFITSVYHNLFNRDPEAGGLAYWKGVLTPANAGDVIFGIASGAQGSDITALNHKIAIAELYTDTVTSNPDIGYSASASAAVINPVNSTDASLITAETSITSLTPLAPVQNFELTIGTDKFTGQSNTNAVFDAYDVNPLDTTVHQTTLTRFDVIDGGSSASSNFNLYSSLGYNDVLQGTVQNVKNINLYNDADLIDLNSALFKAKVTNDITHDFLNQLKRFQDQLGDRSNSYLNSAISDEKLANVYAEINHLAQSAINAFIHDNTRHGDYKYANDATVNAILNAVTAALDTEVSKAVADMFGSITTPSHITYGDLYNAINAALVTVGSDASSSEAAVDSAHAALNSANSGISALQIAADSHIYGTQDGYGVDAAFFTGSNKITLDNGWASVKNITNQVITLQNTAVNQGTNGAGAVMNLSYNVAAGKALNATVNLTNDSFGTEHGDGRGHDKVTTLNILGADNLTSGDVFNLNVNGVTTADVEHQYHHSKPDYNTINLLGIETINITSNGVASSLGYINASDRESAHDYDIVGQQVVNIKANADLLIQVLDTNDTAGRLSTTASLVNISGASNVTIKSIDDSAGYDWFHNRITTYQDGVIVNGSTATGNITLGDGGLQNNVVSVTTGSGDDAVYLANGVYYNNYHRTFSSTVDGSWADQATTTVVSLGAGNDSLFLGGGLNHAGNDVPADLLSATSYRTGMPAPAFSGDGGTGTNTLALDLGLAEFATYVDTNYTLANQVVNFQHLELTGDVAGYVNCFNDKNEVASLTYRGVHSGDFTWHVSPEKLDSINYVTIDINTGGLRASSVNNTNAINDSDYSYLTNSDHIQVSIHNLNTGATLEYAQSQSDALTVIANGDTGNIHDVLNVVLDGTGVYFNAANLIAKQTETINITANGETARTDDSHITQDWISIYDTYAKIVNVTGAGDLHLYLDSKVVQTINASQNNGGLDYTSEALTKALTITGSQAADTLNLSVVKTGATILASAGHDLYTVNTLANTINFGSGVDDLHVVNNGDTDFFNHVDVINNFTLAGDAIRLGDGVTRLDKVATINNGVYSDYVAAALAKETSTGGAAWFQYGGDTYIVQNNGTLNSTFDTSDIIVKLTGTVDLASITTLSTTPGHLVHV
jgi:hypothetical protein